MAKPEHIIGIQEYNDMGYQKDEPLCKCCDVIIGDKNKRGKEYPFVCRKCEELIMVIENYEEVEN